MTFHASHQQADENDCAVVLSLSTVVFRKCAVYVFPSGLTSSSNCLILTNPTTDLSLALKLRLQRLTRFPYTAPVHFLAPVLPKHHCCHLRSPLPVFVRASFDNSSWAFCCFLAQPAGQTYLQRRSARLSQASQIPFCVHHNSDHVLRFTLQATSSRRVRSGFHTRASRHVVIASPKTDTAPRFRTCSAPSPSVSR